jgi:hypothetical protein
MTPVLLHVMPSCSPGEQTGAAPRRTLLGGKSMEGCYVAFAQEFSRRNTPLFMSFVQSVGTYLNLV